MQGSRVVARLLRGMGINFYRVAPPIISSGKKYYPVLGNGIIMEYCESREEANTLAQKLNDEIKQNNIKDGNKGNE